MPRMRATRREEMFVVRLPVIEIKYLLLFLTLLGVPFQDVQIQTGDLTERAYHQAAARPVFWPQGRSLPKYTSSGRVAPGGDPRAAGAEIYPYGNPAGCLGERPVDVSPAKLLEAVQREAGGELILEDHQVFYAWNAPMGSYVDISDDPDVYEFEINQYQPPFTYQADRLVTSFVQHGFSVWLRNYDGIFRLLAVSMQLENEHSIWQGYVDPYWQEDGLPDDPFIVPISKKLPCRWMVEEGLADPAELEALFPLDWHLPDFLEAGRQYLAAGCSEANRIAVEKIGHWSAATVCGPLTWQILHDSAGFPYRIGSYHAGPELFISANPRYGGRRPWIGFDPETYDLIQIHQPMAGYDFQRIGELQPGDLIFSFGSPDQWALGGGNFSHIFLVAGEDEQGARLAITNLVKNYHPQQECSISEVLLYTPGDQENGMIHSGWNDHGYGITGRYGFDVFRWKWISYHLEGEARQYTVRLGDTLDTIAFDWKVAPDLILTANPALEDGNLYPGQVILLPELEP